MHGHVCSQRTRTIVIEVSHDHRTVTFKGLIITTSVNKAFLVLKPVFNYKTPPLSYFLKQHQFSFNSVVFLWFSAQILHVAEMHSCSWTYIKPSRFCCFVFLRWIVKKFGFFSFYFFPSALSLCASSQHSPLSALRFFHSPLLFSHSCI